MDDLFSMNTRSLAPLADRLTSSIFWGPPGCGKTTLASIIAETTRAAFVKLNAVTSGVADVREVLREAENRLKLYGQPTYLLLDECHRWSKSQSDSILPAIEQGTIRFIGSTTENPMIAMTPAIWEQCNAVLQNGLGVRDMIRRADVTDLNTTDDPLDDLRWHEMLAADETLKVHVRPAWRPELALDPANAAFPGYMERLGAPHTMDALQAKLSERMDFFAAHGCTASDHGVTALRKVECSAAELDAILRKASDGRTLTADEISAYQYALLKFLGGEYARRGWVMELHFGVIRNLNERMMRRVGPNTGFDAIAPTTCAEGLPALLDDLSKAGALPKTVLFSLNPNDSAMLNAVAGCFTEEGVRSAVQQGAAWWFNDSLPGMERQMRAMASTAVLGNFLGMVTDSRSFLSYTRHEYFRRLLCNLLGGWVENGEYPADFDALGELVSDVGYRNAMRFFGYSE